MIKLTKVKKGKYWYEDSPDHDYEYKDWKIEGVGGFIMLRHFWAFNLKLKICFWQFKLKEVKELIEKIENDITEFDKMDALFKTALY